MTGVNKHILMSVAIFDKLSDNELEIVSKHIFSSAYNAGDVIFREGTHGNSMCFVLEGELDVIKKKEDGSQVLISTLSPGQSVGEMAMVDGLVRSATIQAKTDVSVLVLNRVQFEKLMAEHPKIAMNIMKTIAHLISINLRKTSNELTKLMLPIT